MNYVISDIHGQNALYKEMLEKINFNHKDTLFVLGDVIDRGPDGIEIIQSIMNSPNIFLLIGNHEHMMLSYYKYKSTYFKNIWINNGGYTTFNKLEVLSHKEKEAILDYLNECPLCIPQYKVNDKYFYLTHAAPLNRKELFFYNDAYVFDIEDAVWNRDFSNAPEDCEFLNRFKNTHIVFGHTQTASLSYGRIDKNGLALISQYNSNIIAIDCGCASLASADSIGQLGCLCLDNFKEYYVTREI